MMPYQYYPSTMNSYYPFLEFPLPSQWNPCPISYFQHQQLSLPLHQQIPIQNPQKSGKIKEKVTPGGTEPCSQVSTVNESSQPAGEQKTIQWNKDEIRMKNQNQIAGRNANSNLLRIFFRQLEQQLDEDQGKIARIIAKEKMKTTCRRFMEWLEINKVEHKNYIRLPCVKKIFIGCKGKEEHPKIMRILLGQFLAKDALSSYLTSKKIKKTMMRFNYQSMRTIFSELKGTSSA